VASANTVTAPETITPQGFTGFTTFVTSKSMVTVLVSPPPGDGFETLKAWGPVVDELAVAVMLVELTYVEASGVPFKRTVDDETKPDPPIDTETGVPTGATVGVRLEIAGIG